MKDYLFLFLMLLGFDHSWAQNSFLDYGRAVKIYNQSTYEIRTRSYTTGDTSMNSYVETDRAFHLIQPVMAFQWKSGNRNFHEVGISRIGLTKRGISKEIKDSNSGTGESIGGQDILEASLAVRYEYIFSFNKKADHKLVPSLGFGAATYYSLVKHEPRITNAFPTSQTQVGLQLFISPRLSYYFSPKWFLDMHFPVCISDLNTTILQVKNPYFTSAQQRNTDHVLTGFPKTFSGLIGIGLKL